MAPKMWTEVLYKINLIGNIVSRETQHTRNMWTKSYCLLLLALLFTIVNSYVPEDGRICVDGKSFDDGCNSCECIRGSVACTIMACHDENGDEIRVSLEPPEDFWEKNKTR